MVHMQWSMGLVSQGQSESWLTFSIPGKLVGLQVVLIGTLTSYNISDLLPKGKGQMCNCLFFPV